MLFLTSVILYQWPWSKWQ